ncbi:MAG: hypothetical protein QOH14_800, partial [Pseudonocardiales bacterium]|nr:hypothetical protein [Pseudonocardiales bacterium]
MNAALPGQPPQEPRPLAVDV